ncbi:MAG: LysE family transporter [Synergistaceae bacterium]|nr:LysE family transporter [Synergistaceae bacterium]
MWKVIMSYLPYALITTFTPGPNNLMSLYSVSSVGWKKGSKVILGIFTGFMCLMLLVVLFCHELAKYLPEFVKYLKYIGAIYILWLAVHIAKSEPGEALERSINFRSGFVLAISNVKVILYLITIFTVYIIPSGANFYEMLLHGAFIIAISAVSWCMWGEAGSVLQRFLTRYYRPFNILMGILLAWCAVKILM